MSERTDLPSFDEIYDAYAEGILNYVNRLVRNKDDASDLTQGIWFKVLKNMGKFEQRSSIKTWIYQIATNEVHNHMKRKHRYSFLTFAQAEMPDPLHPDRRKERTPGLTVTSDPLRMLEESQTNEILRSALASVSLTYRVPLELRYYERMSYKDIAKILKISMSAVEARIHRAKKQLVKKLGSYAT